MIAAGGKTIYGARIGVLMLEAQFPRIPGDAGNAETWPFPVQFRLVRGATPELAVRRGGEGLLEPFIEAGRDLIAHGVEALTTNCGFLAPFQQPLSAALAVPTVASSLMQARLIEAALPPGKRVGILTIDAASLTARHLAAAGAPEDAPVEGADGTELARSIFDNDLRLDVTAARHGMLTAAERLAARPEVGAILLECANMPPYAAAIREAVNLPVFSLYDAVVWLHAGLAPRRWRLGLESGGVG